MLRCYTPKVNIMHKIKLVQYFFIALTVAAFPVVSDENGLTEPSVMIKIMEDSNTTYNISMSEEGMNSDEYVAENILRSDSYLEKNTDGKIILKKYNISPSMNALFIEGDDHFIKKEYDKAIDVWENALIKYPNYILLNTMIGDAYYFKHDYIKAKKYFLKTINENPIDYQARWFLSNTYQKLGDKDAALEQIILAHIYNRYHKEILKTLKGYLELRGLVWEEWDFIPQYQLRKTEKGIDVQVEMDWLGYALAKAIWKFEPGYPKHDTNKDSLVNPREEKEAILMLLSQTENPARINDVIEQGMISSFINYEISLRKYPFVSRLFPSESINDIVLYLKKFHIRGQVKVYNQALHPSAKGGAE